MYNLVYTNPWAEPMIFSIQSSNIDTIYFLLHTITFFTYMADLSKIHHSPPNRYSEYTTPKSTGQNNIWEADASISEEKNLMQDFLMRPHRLELPQEYFQNYSLPSF